MPKIVLIALALLMVVYGLYMSLGALRNWNSFNKAHKRIDLIAMFGDPGRLIYVVAGMAICVVAALCVCGLMGIGPFSKYFIFKQ
ncbi:MAG: hypothetical protein V4580_15045 [Bacteroidota bacterium]